MNSEDSPRFRARALQRFEARVARFWGADLLLPGRICLALFFLWMAGVVAFSPRAALQKTTLDFMAQVLSIASVGHVSFTSAPRCLAAFEVLCALAIGLFPRSRAAYLVLLGRLVWAVLPLLMLRDDLWRIFPIVPTAAGLGVIVGIVPGLWAVNLAWRCRWECLAEGGGTAALLHESPAQVRARKRAWQRSAVVGLPLLIVVSLATRAVWPRYLRWFHARQESAALHEVLKGRLLKKSMPPSVALNGRKITTWVYLPPGYANSTERYPVVYVMHGMPGEVRDCFVKGRVQDDAEHLIMTHQVRPFIIVGWDGEGPGGPGDVTNYLDRPGYAMEAFITQELVPYVDRTYRTIPLPGARALDGISAGGYGAANLMLKYPDIWKIGASHNGFFSPADDVENMNAILGPKSIKWAQNDPTQLLYKRSAADGLHFYGDIGDGDDLQSEFVAFGKKLKARGIQTDMHIFPGRHTWEFWSQHFNNSFRFEDKWFRAAEKSVQDGQSSDTLNLGKDNGSTPPSIEPYEQQKDAG